MQMYYSRLWVFVATSLAGTAAAHAQENHEDEHHVFDEIVVNATPLQRTVEQLAQPTAVLSGEQLIKKQSSSLGETVSQELGMSSTFFGPVASRPVIRGQFGERVRILSNGLDSLDASALSEDHQTSVDSFLASSVEIVRGPATLLYGSGAAGGIVNVVDSRIAEAPLDTFVSGGLAASGDTAVGRRDLAAQVNVGSDQIAFHLDHMQRDTADFSIPGFAESAILRKQEDNHDDANAPFGHVENSDSETKTSGVGLSATGERGFIGVSVSDFDSNYGVAGGHAHAGEEEIDVRIDLDQTRYELRSSYDFDGAVESARFLIAATDYMHTEFEGTEVGTIFETRGTDARLEFKHAAIGDFVGAFGMQYRNIDFNAVGDEAYVPPSDTTETSVFAFEEWAMSDDSVLQASARVEHQTIAPEVDLRNYSGTAYGASLGFIHSFKEKQRIAANLALTERHPNSTELYADGPHVAVQRYERGAITQDAGILRKEQSTNLDLTWRGDTGKREWAVTAFLNQINDYILLAPTATVIDEFQLFEYRQTNARLTGFEAEARFELADTGAGHIHTRLFADMVRGTDRKTGANLPRLPPLRLGIGLHHVINTVETSVEATWFDEQTRTAENELPTASYVLLSADISYAIDDAGIFLFLKGTNLTDEDARQHTSPLKDTLPLPGRALHAGIRWIF